MTTPARPTPQPRMIYQRQNLWLEDGSHIACISSHGVNEKGCVVPAPKDIQFGEDLARGYNALPALAAARLALEAICDAPLPRIATSSGSCYDCCHCGLGHAPDCELGNALALCESALALLRDGGAV